MLDLNKINRYAFNLMSIKILGCKVENYKHILNEFYMELYITSQSAATKEALTETCIKMQ